MSNINEEMFQSLKKFINTFKNEILVYKNVIAHPDCPKLSRWCLALAVFYALSPIDVIPDFIPVLGYLDDVIILAILITIAVKLTPKSLIDEVRTKMATN
ncbi:MAG: DUF1232 domain-containing protein [Victivallaceae bacterium]|nr:DUF1232 domain-containing protein [Victivallaceae bacterium]